MWRFKISYLHSAGDWAISGSAQGSQNAVRASSFVPCYASSGYASSEIQLGYTLWNQHTVCEPASVTFPGGTVRIIRKHRGVICGIVAGNPF